MLRFVKQLKKKKNHEYLYFILMLILTKSCLNTLKWRSTNFNSKHVRVNVLMNPNFTFNFD